MNNENTILLSQNFITNTEQIKQFRINLFNKDKNKTLELFDILLKNTTITKLITELINIWIEYYLYETFYLGVIFISINSIKITKLNKPYVICLLKYTVNILLLHNYNKDIIKQDKTNVLDFSNIEKLRELNITEDKFKLFNIDISKNDNDNLSFKALYISYKNSNYEYLIKSLNTLLLHINQIDILHNLWNFILHIDEDFDYSSKLCFQLCNMKILKKSSKYILLYYIYLIHIEHFKLDNFFDKLEETLINIDKFQKTYSICNNENMNDNENNEENKEIIKENFNYYIVKQDEDIINECQLNDKTHKTHKNHKKDSHKKENKYKDLLKDKNKMKSNIDSYRNYKSLTKKIDINTKEIVTNIISDVNKHNEPKVKSKHDLKEEKKRHKENEINNSMKYLMFVPMKDINIVNNSNINKFDYIPRY
jgi:hypothetical protein